MSTKQDSEVAREIDKLDETIKKIIAKRAELKLQREALREEMAGLKAEQKELRQSL